MRVLQLLYDYGWVGGIESYTQKATEDLRRRGHDVHIICDVLDPAAVIDDFVHLFPGYRAATNAGDVEATSAVFATINAIAPDVIVGQSAGCSALLVLCNQRYPTFEFFHAFACMGSKLFRNGDQICTHSVGAQCLVDWYRRRCGFSANPSVAWESLRFARSYIGAMHALSGVFVANEFMRDYLINEGVAASKISIVDLADGIGPEWTKAPPASAKATLLVVSRLVYNKGIQYAIQALTALTGPGNDGIELQIAGDGYYGDELKQLATRLGVGHRVHFDGMLRDTGLEQAYQNADILLIPSIWPEPAGLVIPEARARGLPVVASDVGGIPQWLSSYGYGGIRLVPPGDPPAIGAAVRDLLSGEARLLAGAADPKLLSLARTLEKWYQTRSPATR